MKSDFERSILGMPDPSKKCPKCGAIGGVFLIGGTGDNLTGVDIMRWDFVCAKCEKGWGEIEQGEGDIFESVRV